MQYLLDNKVKNLPSTPLKLCISLLQGNYTPHELWAGRKFRLKFMFRSLVLPFSTRKILKFITAHPHYEQLLKAQPRLPCRLHRPYLSNRLNRREGVQAITYHYKELNETLGTEAFIQHLSNRFFLAEFQGKSKAIYHLNFVSLHKLDREGEASLVLKNNDNEMLCEMTFTICERSGKKVLMIGGLQGPSGEGSQEKVHFATKDFFGIFPKKLVFESLVTLAKMLNVNTIFAVSNETHVYQTLRYQKRQQVMYANYSNFWEMMGGIILADGIFELQCNHKRKDIESIPSKKRAEYRRRYELLDTVNDKIIDVLRYQKKLIISKR